MTFAKLVFRSLLHYRWLNAMVLLGVALTCAIISGSLVVGDSVKESLLRNAHARISGVDSVLVGGDRFFSAALADRVGHGVAPILQVEGTVSTRGRGSRLNSVQIIGVEERFWAMSVDGAVPEGAPTGEALAINEVLANRLGVKSGETLVCRVEIPGELSKDAPLSGESEQTQPFTGKVSAVLGADQLGLYSLRAEQVPRGTIYLPLQRLQTILQKEGQANLMLGPAEATPTLREDVEQHWQLDDASLELKDNQLTSRRIFIDSHLSQIAQEQAEQSGAVLTYLANKIRCGDRLTPYSMVTGAAANLPSPLAKNLKDDEIILSQWLADDLAAQPGDQITLDYYVVGTGRKLVETSAEFRVHSIGRLGEKGWDQSWTPEFPGIFEVDDLDDWEPGIPIDRSIIRDKDEDYWDDHRATPKAFITLAAAQRLFANRFGNATSIRVPNADAEAYAAKLKDNLTLGDIGLTTRHVSKEAEQAVAGSMDFGGLFASMSFFLIIAALALTALVFIFGIESRRDQIGLLLATGFRAGKVRRLFLSEAVLLSILGALLGILGGWCYTKLALAGMSSAWQDAASGIDFVYHVEPATLIGACVATIILALGTVWFASRLVTKVRPSQLISGSSDYTGRVRSLVKTFSFWGLILFLLMGLGMLLAPKLEGSMIEQMLFFFGGFYLTMAGLCAVALWLRAMQKPQGDLTSLNKLGRQNAVRRKGRSLAVVGLMAAGVFMVTAINSFRLDGSRGAERRDSGTGGYSYAGQSTLPIYVDLNSKAGREKFLLDQFDSSAFRIVQFRVSDGEDASCLNLNRAQRPRLMGVDPEQLKLNGDEQPFKMTTSLGPKSWEVLDWIEGEGIPAVVDMNTAMYALHGKAGDILEYNNTADETFQVQMAALLDTSLLQGNLIISEDHFIRQFPNSGGYRFFLLDCQDAVLAEKIAKHMTRMFEHRGLEMRPASDKLNEFNAVQNTYLSIFSTLGGLGLLLGTIGLAIVVGRNVMERRGQLGLMQAVGFDRDALAKMVLSEHWFLHVSGVAIGFGAAMIAVLPKLLSRASELPWSLILGINAAILVGGLVFCWVAAKMALRGKLIDALRTE